MLGGYLRKFGLGSKVGLGLGGESGGILPDPSAWSELTHSNIAFGQGGPHICLGIWLARLEVRILLQEFVKRVKVLEQAGPHEFLRSNFIGGIKRLPVKVTLQ